MKASLVAEMIKNLPAMHETRVRSLGAEDPLEKGMATHSSILSWFQGHRSLVGYSPWGHKEPYRTEWQTLSLFTFIAIVQGWGCWQDRMCAEHTHLLSWPWWSSLVPLNLGSGGFLAAPSWTRNYSNLPFGSQGRSWMLESCLQDMEDKTAFVPSSPH